MSDYDYEDHDWAQYRALEREEYDRLDRKRKLDEAVRLTADAVLAAADRGYPAELSYDHIEGMEEAGERWMAELGRAVLAHRKAKAEQAKEASRG